MRKIKFLPIVILFFLFACNENKTNNQNFNIVSSNIVHYVSLTADIDNFSESNKEVIKCMILASDYIDSMFFYENCENYKEFLAEIKDEETKKQFVYNFGPWNRFNENKPFIEGVPNKPLGSNFYPSDMTVEEFNNFSDSNKLSHYTFIRRDGQGNLYCLPYHEKFEKYIDSISKYLLKAAEYTDDENLSEYLKQRSLDLKTDDYSKSDSMWVRLQSNSIDFVIGPVQILDDVLFNLKAEHQSFVLIKDEIWTEKMHKYNKWLRFLQKAIPVPEQYRAEEPGSNSSISVYDIIYYGGSGKTGGTLISVVLPLNVKTQMSQGVKNLQFKNTIEYKFDEVAKPISEIILTEEQNNLVTSNAFFVNTILYEMAGSLGIRNTLNGKGSVRNALKEYYTVSSYIKNYALSLFLAEKLNEVNELENNIIENYYTFVVDLVRLIRFGMNNEYAVSNLVCYNYLVENEAIKYDKNQIIIDYEKIKIATEKLTKDIIIMQGDGDYEAVKTFIESHKYIDKNLYDLINNINQKNVPTDIVIQQGKDFLNF